MISGVQEVVWNEEEKKEEGTAYDQYIRTNGDMILVAGRLGCDLLRHPYLSLSLSLSSMPKVVRSIDAVLIL